MSLDWLKEEFMLDFPRLTWLTVDNAAKYLGVWLGPGSRARYWVDALKKYVFRARGWAEGAFGLLLGARIYNVFVVSTLAFLLQF